jgi:hypothetical protein
MLRIVVGGQLAKEKIAELVIQTGGDQVRVTIMQDIGAAMAIKNGTADYYIGACNTGGGGALALAIAILGMSLCETLTTPGRTCDEAKIINALNNGKKAFGVTDEHVPTVIPMLIKELIARQN